MRDTYRCCPENLKGNAVRRCGLGSSGSGEGCEHGNEQTGSITGGEVLHKLSSYQLLSKVFFLWLYSP
jgi:hypothetical protein